MADPVEADRLVAGVVVQPDALAQHMWLQPRSKNRFLGNSTLLSGDAVESVAKLKQDQGADVVVLGSGQLVRTLMRANLIDEWVLLVHPLVLGSGIRLFPHGGPNETLQLIDSKIRTKGVVIATYQPANQEQTPTI